MDEQMVDLKCKVRVKYYVKKQMGKKVVFHLLDKGWENGTKLWMRRKENELNGEQGIRE